MHWFCLSCLVGSGWVADTLQYPCENRVRFTVRAQEHQSQGIQEAATTGEN